jgi:hypothetical protein
MADAIEEAHRLANLHMTAKAHHREDANLALKPHLEQLRTAYELSAKLAEQAIKSGFILNGGALVLLSGFAAFLN